MVGFARNGYERRRYSAFLRTSSLSMETWFDNGIRLIDYLACDSRVQG